MKILAFETSCDDTAVAIIEDGWRVIASKRVSQVEHSAWGGVVPEIAARLHAENWKGVLESCLDEANLSIEDIDALAVTKGPGLQTSLLTGTTAASFLSLCYKKPLIPVHHIHGHLASVFLEREGLEELHFFPSLVLTASGGHTELYKWDNATQWYKLGKTLDDACGEAFDKCAKMLGLGYPGGPIIGEKARLGDRLKYNLPVPNTGKESLDFSFSGLKASIYRLVASQEGNIDEVFINDVSASFEYTVGKIFTKKIKRSLDQNPELKTFCFVGGVSANTYLNKVIKDFLQPYGIQVFTPQKIEYSTDNAAMIGSAAYALYKKDPLLAKVQFVDPHPRLEI